MKDITEKVKDFFVLVQALGVDQMDGAIWLRLEWEFIGSEL